MRKILIEKTALKFDELNDEQKDKVIEKLWDLNVDSSYWSESVIEDYTNILEILGFKDIKIYFSGFSSQGDGACFEAKFSLNALSTVTEKLEKLKEYAPIDEKLHLLAQRLLENAPYELLDEDVYTLELYQRGHYYHEYCMFCDNDDSHFLEACRGIAGIIYRALNNDYDYLTSREAIVETIEINEYEFDSETLNII
jgi:hypothetical protein